MRGSLSAGEELGVSCANWAGAGWELRSRELNKSWARAAGWRQLGGSWRELAGSWAGSRWRLGCSWAGAGREFTRRELGGR